MLENMQECALSAHLWVTGWLYPTLILSVCAQQWDCQSKLLQTLIKVEEYYISLLFTILVT